MLLAGISSYLWFSSSLFAIWKNIFQSKLSKHRKKTKQKKTPMVIEQYSKAVFRDRIAYSHQFSLGRPTEPPVAPMPEISPGALKIQVCSYIWLSLSICTDRFWNISETPCSDSVPFVSTKRGLVWSWCGLTSLNANNGSQWIAYLFLSVSLETPLLGWGS